MKNHELFKHDKVIDKTLEIGWSKLEQLEIKEKE